MGTHAAVERQRRLYNSRPRRGFVRFAFVLSRNAGNPKYRAELEKLLPRVLAVPRDRQELLLQFGGGSSIGLMVPYHIASVLCWQVLRTKDDYERAQWLEDAVVWCEFGLKLARCGEKCGRLCALLSARHAELLLVLKRQRPDAAQSCRNEARKHIVCASKAAAKVSEREERKEVLSEIGRVLLRLDFFSAIAYLLAAYGLWRKPEPEPTAFGTL